MRSNTRRRLAQCVWTCVSPMCGWCNHENLRGPQSFQKSESFDLCLSWRFWLFSSLKLCWRSIGSTAPWPTASSGASDIRRVGFLAAIWRSCANVLCPAQPDDGSQRRCSGCGCGCGCGCGGDGQTNLSTRTHTRTHTHTHARAQTDTRAHTRAHTHTDTHAHTHAHTRTTHTHTHTPHTHARTPRTHTHTPCTYKLGSTR